MRSLRNRRKKTITLPEITLTPLIDTALTLLIIFMVTTPMIQHSLKVKLPQGGNAQQAGSKAKPFTVTITKDNEIFVNDKKATSETVLSMLDSQKKEYEQQNIQYENKVWVRADGGSITEKFLGVVNILQSHNNDPLSQDKYVIAVAMEKPTQNA